MGINGSVGRASFSKSRKHQLLREAHRKGVDTRDRAAIRRFAHEKESNFWHGLRDRMRCGCSVIHKQITGVTL